MNSTQQWQSVTWFDVDEHQEGQRIDNFLFTRLKGVPKSRIYRLIREGQVRVNKKRIKAETRLSIGDQIRVAPIRYEQKDESDVPVSAGVAQSLLSRVVYEDEGLLVINKPSGIAVHGGSGVAYGLIEALRAATGKKYLEGQVSLDQQLIDAPLLRYELANGERRVRVTKDGKPSKTDWKVVERFKTATLVHASPLSGRTHQIRVHGLSIGHPLIGDDKYGHNTAYAGPEARRLCLHAMRLEIPNYPIIEAPMPEDMQQVIDQLRKQK